MVLENKSPNHIERKQKVQGAKETVAENKNVSDISKIF